MKDWKPWTPEEDALVRAAVAERSDYYSALAGVINRSRRGVAWRVRTMGWDRCSSLYRRRWTKEEDCYVLRTIEGTLSIAEAAAIVGRSRESVSRRRHILGYKWQPSVNEAFFDDWTPHVAYVVGYTWADGTVGYFESSGGSYGRLAYGCTESDGNLLRSIASVMGWTGKFLLRSGAKAWNKQKGHWIVSKPLIQMRISSTRLVNRLVAYGILPNKSNIDPAFPSIPATHAGDFFRGCIDGDGTITPGDGGKRATTIILYGSLRFLTGLSQRLHEQFGVRLAVPLRNRKLWRISWGAVRDVQILADAMYGHNPDLLLTRKRDKLYVDGRIQRPNR